METVTPVSSNDAQRLQQDIMSEASRAFQILLEILRNELTKGLGKPKETEKETLKDKVKIVIGGKEKDPNQLTWEDYGKLQALSQKDVGENHPDLANIKVRQITNGKEQTLLETNAQGTVLTNQLKTPSLPNITASQAVAQALNKLADSPVKDYLVTVNQQLTQQLQQQRLQKRNQQLQQNNNDRQLASNLRSFATEILKNSQPGQISGNKYDLEKKGDTYQLKSKQGAVLMKFQDKGVFGTKVLESNLTPEQKQDIKQLGNFRKDRLFFLRNTQFLSNESSFTASNSTTQSSQPSQESKQSQDYDDIFKGLKYIVDKIGQELDNKNVQGFDLKTKDQGQTILISRSNNGNLVASQDKNGRQTIPTPSSLNDVQALKQIVAKAVTKVKQSIQSKRSGGNIRKGR